MWNIRTNKNLNIYYTEFLKMIIIKLTGGLGNQLFQYGFGRYLSEKFNSELKFDVQTINDSANFTNRSFGLENFNIKVNLATSSDISTLKYFSEGLFGRIERKLIQNVPFLNPKYMVQSSNDYKTNIKNIRDNCYYDGYWQSEKYFKPIETILKTELQYTAVLNDKNALLLTDIINNESISVHIRRGDYLSIKVNGKLFAVCSDDYYKQAINYFLNKNDKSIFYIFSDDVDWAKSNFNGDSYLIVDNNANNPEIDLYLMSNCKHNIIANSSYSWWGAWLNRNSDKTIIAPKQWYRGKQNEMINDLIPSKWIKL